MMSRPARSWSRMARMVASSCACSSHCGSTRHNSRARTRGGKRPASLARSINQSGCAYEPTSDVGKSFSTWSSQSCYLLPELGAGELRALREGGELGPCHVRVDALHADVDAEAAVHAGHD